MIQETSRAALLCVVMLVVCAQPSYGQTAPQAKESQATETQTKESLTVAEAVRAVLARNPRARAAELKVDATRQRVRSVSARRTPSTVLTADTGLIPEARGDVLFSEDSADGLGGLAPFIRLDLSMVMPLYSFGALSKLEQTAREGLAASEQERNQVQNQLALQVAQAYWTIVGTRRASEVANEMQEQYDDLSDQVRERYDKEPDDFELIDDTDVLEIDANRYDVDRLVLESANGVALATSFFNALLLRDPAEPVRLSSETTPELDMKIGQIPDLVKIAERQHPQLRALSAAVAGLDARVSSQKRKILPALFLVGRISYAGASNRTDQTNPFVLDQFNFFRGAIQFRARWDLDFGRNRIEVTRLRIERESTAAMRQALLSKVKIDVDRATRQLLLNRDLWQNALQAQTAARSWLRLSMDNWELGIGEVKRLLDAYKAFYRLRIEVIERQRAVDVSLAKLGFAVGDFGLYLSWMANGKVAL